MNPVGIKIATILARPKPSLLMTTILSDKMEMKKKNHRKQKQQELESELEQQHEEPTEEPGRGAGVVAAAA